MGRQKAYCACLKDDYNKLEKALLGIFTET